MTYVLHYVSADLDLDRPNLLSWSVYREEYPSLADSDGDPIAGSTIRVSGHATEAEADAEARRLQAKPLCLVWREPHNDEGDRYADSQQWPEAWWSVGPSEPGTWSVGLTWNVYDGGDIVDQPYYDFPNRFTSERQARGYALHFEAINRTIPTAAATLAAIEPQ